MRKLLTTGAIFAASFGIAAGPAGAATQKGLVNVNVEDVVVQVPVAAAANLCDIDVNVLARTIGQGGAECDSDADADAFTMSSAPGGTRQEGLVNVNVEDVRVQVPVAVAADICDVSVGVLSTALLEGPTTCDAVADATATA